MPEDELRKTAADAIDQINSWFTSNPKRRVCHAELWYGKRLAIKRKTVAKQINTLLAETLTKQAKKEDTNGTDS